MKIATWSLERLARRKNQAILDKLQEVDADILILTETSSAIGLDNYNCASTNFLPNFFDGIKYNNGENRVSIWTKHPVKGAHESYDGFTSVCCDIGTPFGLLTVYGTIIGQY